MTMDANRRHWMTTDAARDSRHERHGWAGTGRVPGPHHHATGTGPRQKTCCPGSPGVSRAPRCFQAQALGGGRPTGRRGRGNRISAAEGGMSGGPGLRAGPRGFYAGRSINGIPRLPVPTGPMPQRNW